MSDALTSLDSSLRPPAVSGDLANPRTIGMAGVG
jgi:hypothetical protein